MRFEAWVDAHVVNGEVPSVAVAVVHDQTLVWSRAFGVADIDARIPATTDTRYRIGSITKLFTATAVLQLRDAGALRLDDPVTRHVPWFQMPRDASLGSGEVTVRHLLTHTAGLPRESAFPYWTDFRFPSTDALRAALAKQTAIFPLDSQWKYSNLAFALAGAVVASASGLTYADYVRARILEPLGMPRTLVEAPTDGASDLARGYGRRLPGRHRALRPICDMRALASAGNMTSTVHDLAKFAMLQFRLDHADEAAVDTAPHDYTHRAMRLLLPALTQAAGASTRATTIDPAWARYAGRYRGDWGDVQVLLTERGLEVIAPLADDPMPGRIMLTPVAEHTFRMTCNDGYDVPGELVTFELGPDGRVVTARFAMEPIVPVAAWS
jgi:CubicO group peptidase (beta-lactamase class C family)